MDLNVFRRFFGYKIPYAEGSDDQEFIRNQKNFNEFPFDSFEDSSDDIFKQMDFMFEKMFNSFNLLGFPSFEDQFENLTMLDDHSVLDQSPRSLMLKDEDNCFSPSCKKKEEKLDVFSDLNLDEKTVTKFSTDEEECKRMPHHFSFSKFSSFKTVKLPDGTVEEHKTIVDSVGNKTTKIKRSIGKTSHEIITKINEKGIEEKEESYVNMDESVLGEFENRWKRLKEDNMKTIEIGMCNPSTRPSYFDIIKQFFGSKNSDLKTEFI